MSFFSRLFGRKDDRKSSTAPNDVKPVIDPSTIDFSNITKVEPNMDAAPTLANEAIQPIGTQTFIDSDEGQYTTTQGTQDVGPVADLSLYQSTETTPQPSTQGSGDVMPVFEPIEIPGMDLSGVDAQSAPIMDTAPLTENTVPAAPETFGQEPLMGEGTTATLNGLAILEEEEVPSWQDERVNELEYISQALNAGRNPGVVGVDAPYLSPLVSPDEEGNAFLEAGAAISDAVTGRGIARDEYAIRTKYFPSREIGRSYLGSRRRSSITDEEIQRINTGIDEAINGLENPDIVTPEDYEAVMERFKELLPDAYKDTSFEKWQEFTEELSAFYELSDQRLKDNNFYTSTRVNNAQHEDYLTRTSARYAAIEGQTNEFLLDPRLNDTDYHWYDGLTEGRKQQVVYENKKAMTHLLDTENVKIKEVEKKIATLKRQGSDYDDIKELEDLVNMMIHNRNVKFRKSMEYLEYRQAYLNDGYSAGEADNMVEEYIIKPMGFNTIKEFIDDGTTGGSGYKLGDISNRNKWLAISADQLYNIKNKDRNIAQKTFYTLFNGLQGVFNAGDMAVSDMFNILSDGIDNIIGDLSERDGGFTFGLQAAGLNALAKTSNTQEGQGTLRKMFLNALDISPELMTFIATTGLSGFKMANTNRYTRLYSLSDSSYVNRLRSIGVDVDAVQAMDKFTRLFDKVSPQVNNMARKLAGETILEAKINSWEINTGDPTQRASLFYIGYPFAIAGDAIRLGKTVLPEITNGKMFGNTWNDALDAIEPYMLEKFGNDMPVENIKKVASAIKKNSLAYADMYDRIMALDSSIVGVKDMQDAIKNITKREYIKGEIMRSAYKAGGEALDQADQQKLLSMMKEYGDDRYGIYDMFKLNAELRGTIGNGIVGSRVLDAQTVANVGRQAASAGDVQRIIDGNFDYQFSTLVRDVMEVEGKAFNPNQIYSPTDLEIIGRNIKNKNVYDDLLKREGDEYVYFRKEGDGYVLNAKGFKRLDIRDRSTGLARFTKEISDDSVDFTQAAQASKLMDDAEILMVTKSGAVDDVTNFFKDLTNC